METIKQINENLRIRIIETDNMSDPYSLCIYEDCEFVLKSNRYFNPDRARSLDDFELVGNIDKDVEIIEKETGKKTFPLYAYVHGDVRLSLAPFSCFWDSGCLGFVLAEDEETAKSFVAAVDRYLNEPEYAYIFEEREPLFNKDGEEVSEEWNEVDSSYGYYSEEEAMNEAMNFIPVKQ